MASPIFRPALCKEKEFLEQQFDAAVKELVELHNAEIDIRMHGADAARFDLAVKLAQRKRAQAKRRLLDHLDSHHCWHVE